MASNDDRVPQWAKQAIWYQIFPERFRNGSSQNDPTLVDIHGAWPDDPISPWQIHPWTSDWYELQPYEKANRQRLWYNIVRRRYEGDLQYEPEAYLPDGTRRAVADPVEINHDLLSIYKKLIHIRKTNPALSLGDFETLVNDDANQIYVFRRSYEGHTLVVALNNTKEVQSLHLKIPAKYAVDILNDEVRYVVDRGVLSLQLPRLWGVILRTEN